jgi:hypothetical protein
MGLGQDYTILSKFKVKTVDARVELMGRQVPIEVVVGKEI